jgi:hypothetical protein
MLQTRTQDYEHYDEYGRRRITSCAAEWWDKSGINRERTEELAKRLEELAEQLNDVAAEWWKVSRGRLSEGYSLGVVASRMREASGIVREVNEVEHATDSNG